MQGIDSKVNVLIRVSTTSVLILQLQVLGVEPIPNFSPQPHITSLWVFYPLLKPLIAGLVRLLSKLGLFWTFQLTIPILTVAPTPILFLWQGLGVQVGALHDLWMQGYSGGWVDQTFRIWDCEAGAGLRDLNPNPNFTVPGRGVAIRSQDRRIGSDWNISF